MSKCCLCLFWSVLTPLSAWGQWTASAYLGKTHTRAADIRISTRTDTDVEFENVAFDDRSFDRPLYYGLRAGYMFTRSAGLEGEFIHIKAFARVNEAVSFSGRLPAAGNISTTIAPRLVLAQYGVSHGLNLALGNFILKHELTERLAINFRAGLGIAIPHPEIRAFGGAFDEYLLQGAAIQLAGGGEFELSRRVFWLAEYKFTNTRQRYELGFATIENTFGTHHLVTGLGFRF
jgi:lipid A oxidase